MHAVTHGDRLCLSRSGRERTRADGRIVVGCAPSLGGRLAPCRAQCPIRGINGDLADANPKPYQ
jgi:hypothetical protein